MDTFVLEMRDIDKSFKGTHALKDINFQLKQGEVHALLGENGAGKSTLMKILGGIYKPDRGTISIDGRPVRIEGVHSAQGYGIGLIHQEIILVPYLTVADNIFLGREPVTKLGLKNTEYIYEQSAKMVESLGLDLDVHDTIESLTIAQQQMVEIVKAVSFNVRILIMDEPTSSLSDKEVSKLFEIIQVLKEKKVSIIYISHRMEELFRISDRVTVIRDGTYIGTRNTRETNSDELVSMMVGRKLESFYERTSSVQKEEILRVEHLAKKGVFEDVSFSVHKGEILGFSGLIGAGRSEIMMSIFGGDGYDGGNVFLEGKKVVFKNTRAAIRHGVAMVPEDRKRQGLILIGSVAFNIMVANLKSIMNGILISEKREKKLVDRYIDYMHVKTASSETAVEYLSGGNQQKVVLAKWLATAPKLLILDEPTRGIDVGAKHEIYTIINDLTNQGLAIILISSELPEILNMCDNVCVVRNGKIAAQLGLDELSQENIMKYATGGK